MFYINPRSLSLLAHIDLASFKPSCITVVEGSSSIVPGILFRLCAASVVSLGREAMFVDGWNSFDPYALSKVAKSLGAEPRKVLSCVHVARAFTEYQMDVLVNGPQDAIERWSPAVLAVSYLPSLFSSTDGRKLFEPLLMRLQSLTASSGIITVITSFGGSWYGDRLLASVADRIVRIEHPSKKLIRIIDDGHVTDYMPVPPGQMRFTDFTGGDVYGQDRTKFPQPA